MELVEQIKERTVIDYDFMFVSGTKLAVTVDPEAGDAFTDNGTHYSIHISKKPGLVEGEFTDEEDLTVFKGNLAVLATCKRKQRLPTREEAEETSRLIHALVKGVQ